eukprot:TRINITY_DN50793_c0_g1_i1.p1 TRINITY_DN50793_c0_g1~~TRINITY_DN50793_c0_g1_i1.p1  ORF type:complete len:447 (+),score=136.59 TRINITY_DN50793_c0_g1_i1:65-1342(+)
MARALAAGATGGGAPRMGSAALRLRPQPVGPRRRLRRTFRTSAALLKYHQEMFMPRQDFFLVQVMRGLKVEKRYEPGMGWGIFVRDGLQEGELIMYDLPFLSLDLEEAPQKVADSLVKAGIEDTANSVLGLLVSKLNRLSQSGEDTCRQWLVERQIDIDIMWVTLLAFWAKQWCSSPNPNLQVPLSYFSYIDEYRSDDLEARVMVLGWEAICEVVGMDKTLWDIEEFWVTFYKYRSNVFRDRLFPVCPTLINHSCWPNAHVTPDGALVADRDLHEGDQILLSLYGQNCAEVEEKKLCGSKFKCMIPGCQFTKRIPGHEGVPVPPQPQARAEDREYLTPWHAHAVAMPAVGVDTDAAGAWKAPADEKFRKMWKTELTRAGRQIGEAPKLPGARRIAAGTGVVPRGTLEGTTVQLIRPPDRAVGRMA